MPVSRQLRVLFICLCVLIVTAKVQAQQLVAVKDTSLNRYCLKIFLERLSGITNFGKEPSLFTTQTVADSSLILSDSIITAKITELKSIVSINVPITNDFKRGVFERIRKETDKITSISDYKSYLKSRHSISLDGMEINYTYSFTYREDSSYVDNKLAQHFTYVKADMTILNTLPLTMTYMMRNSNSFFYKNYNDFQVSYNGNAARAKYVKLDEVKKQLLSSAFSKQKLFDVLDSQYQIVDNIEKKLKNPYVQEYLQKAKSEVMSRANIKGVDVKSVNIENKFASEKVDSLLKNFCDTCCFKEREKIISYLNKLEEFELLYDSSVAKLQLYKKHIDSIIKIYRKYEGFHDNIRDGNYDQLLQHSGIVDSTQKTISSSLSTVSKGFAFLSGVKKFSFGRSVGNASALSFSGYSIKGIVAEYNKNNFYAYTAAGVIDNSLRLNKKFFQELDQRKIVMGRIGYGNIDKNIIIFSFWNGYNADRNSTAVNKITSGTSLQVKYDYFGKLYFIGEVAQSFGPKVNLKKIGNNSAAYSIQLNGRFYKQGLFFSGLYRSYGDGFSNFSTDRINNLKESWKVQADKKFFRNAVNVKLGIKKNFFEVNPMLAQTTLSSDNILKTASVSLKYKRLPQIMFAYQPVTQIISVDSVLTVLTVQTYTASLTHRFKAGTSMNNTSIVFNKVASEYQSNNFLLQSASMFSLQHQILFRKFSSMVNIDVVKNREILLTTLQGGHDYSPMSNFNIGLGYKVYAYSNALVHDNKVGFYNNLRYSIKNKYTLSINMERSFITTNQLNLVKYENYFITMNLKLK